MIRILTFSSLYPNAAQPQHGLFVEQRLRQLLGSGAVEGSVIAPIPWFPFRAPVFGRYARFAAAPRAEHRHGIDVMHPHYPVLPKIGMGLAPASMAACCTRAVHAALAQHPDVGLIDAHYFYPDGVAAAHIAGRLHKPLVITARGSDINLIANYAGPRRRILWAARRAAAVVAVSAALKTRLVALGVPAEHVFVLRNGVDHEAFAPMPRIEARRLTGLDDGPTLLSAGNLIELKGHHLVIEALAQLPGCRLVIAGDGPDRQRLERLAGEHGVSDRVRFTGSVPQQQLRQYYCAADALVLASSREGMANVLLESLACGTPVVATAVSGTPEVIAVPAAGRLVHDRNAAALAAAIQALLAEPPAIQDTLDHARRFSWAETTRGQVELFERIVNR